VKYRSINELSKFEYHDAIIEKFEFMQGNLIVEVSGINITTANPQNTFEKDMCTHKANIIFEGATVEKIIISGYESLDSDMKLIEKVADVEVKKEEYNSIFDNAEGAYGHISSMEILTKLEDGKYQICFCIDAYHIGWYYLTLVFERGIVEWDEFNGEAWYEHETWKKER